jgi:hypothetical protein
MKLTHLVLLTAAAGALTACDAGTDVTVTNQGPLAYVRYVHAMPDTTAVDVRVTDIVHNLNCYGVPYRTVCPYQGVPAGTRHFKVFTTSTAGDINVVSQVIHEQDVPLSANTYYTILHSGFARTGGAPADNFTVIEDQAPALQAGKYALRAIVAAPGFAAAQDVYVTPTATSPLPASPTFNAVALGTPSAWVQLDTGAAVVRSFDDNTTATARVSSTVIAGSRPTEPNSVATPSAGSRVGGALTVFLFPAGPAGTGAAGAGYGVDRRP